MSADLEKHGLGRTGYLLQFIGDASDLDDGSIGPCFPPCRGGPKQVGPKRKTVTLWTCCVCGHSGMSVNIAACQSCTSPRCAYCLVERVKTRPVDICDLGTIDPELREGDREADPL
ncbi:hypothetical protein AU210_012311 [Fusarium oxysporum f. sp. radicis-cucumerinum]|uniref:Uncharacterized protein n=1 Tax=Fusarium oxysporum f. sp. radicis-cucumerinum TaxID=327505 RepID=A0A2H3G4Z0_FUSOX|nr:hypothetical protein AU210_012311 [Fusarium oxysporum f. sp. radicis-cucumerinum]